MSLLLGKENRKQLKIASRVGAVGIELVLAVAVGWYGGRWLDAELGSTPYLAYFGVLCGIIAGFRGLAYLVRRTDLEAM